MNEKLIKQKNVNVNPVLQITVRQTTRGCWCYGSSPSRDIRFPIPPAPHHGNVVFQCSCPPPCERTWNAVSQPLNVNQLDVEVPVSVETKSVQYFWLESYTCTCKAYGHKKPTVVKTIP